MEASLLLHLLLRLNNTFYNYFVLFWGKILRLCHCGSVKYVSGLAITKIYVDFKLVIVLATFFTNHGKNITLLRAAILSNVREGLSGLTVLLFTHLSDAFGCHQMVILCSTVAFLIGLVLLYLTTAEVITQCFLLYTLVASVIGVSISGWQPILTGFFKGQLKNHDIQGLEEVGKDSVHARLKMWNNIASLLAMLLIVILLPVPGWRADLFISASMVGFSCLLFAGGASKFHHIDPIITPLTIIGNVLRAAYSKRNLPLNMKLDVGVGRCIGKAAIIEEKLEGQGRCCTATQVMETKLVLTMLPMWVIVSVGFGLVQTTGNTFFPEQVDNMHSQIGIMSLLFLQGVIKALTSNFYGRLLKRLPKEKRRCWMVIRICLVMALYTLCFLFAWYVEVHKLRVVEKNGLQLKLKDKIPVSTWILVPQFFFSGCAKGLVSGVVHFYKYQVPKSMESYGDMFHSFFVGIGNILSIACLVGFRSYFGQSLNSSRLDKYYMFIILSCASNFFLSSGLLVWIYLFKFNVEVTGFDTQIGEGGEMVEEPAAELVEKVDCYFDGIMSDAAPVHMNTDDVHMHTQDIDDRASTHTDIYDATSAHMDIDDGTSAHTNIYDASSAHMDIDDATSSNELRRL